MGSLCIMSETHAHKSVRPHKTDGVTYDSVRSISFDYIKQRLKRLNNTEYIFKSYNCIL